MSDSSVVKLDAASKAEVSGGWCFNIRRLPGCMYIVLNNAGTCTYVARPLLDHKLNSIRDMRDTRLRNANVVLVVGIGYRSKHAYHKWQDVCKVVYTN
jgi:hypothetical protein